MCGRYASARKRQELVDEFEIQDLVGEELPPDYNVAPTKQVYAVMDRSAKQEQAEPGPPVRQLRAVKWGLVPSWAKDPGIGSRLINARVETADSKPSFRAAFARRRCILPADGFYEWFKPEKEADGTKPAKRPFFIHRRDDASLAMAGLYELWRDPEKDREDESAWLWTATILTTSATDDVGHIHDRMPMMVPADAIEEWLDPRVKDVGRLHELIMPPIGLLSAYPVSTMVNNVRNNGPDLLAPLPDDAGSANTATTLF